MLPRSARAIARLLERLPGVGERTASRYVVHLLGADPEVARALGRALVELHQHVRPCERCGNLAEVEIVDAPVVCEVCADPRRDPTLLCVVAKVSDLSAIERSGAMRGR
ncbi:MAG: recombination protein RecR, partial [Myxococcales bacterium]|nr:recombination protein RecR [Myxococcales bacterium]